MTKKLTLSTLQKKRLKVAKDLMASTDDSLKYKGAMLAGKILEKTPDKETTTIDPFVMGFIMCIQKLSDELSMSGEQILAIFGEDIPGVEAFIRDRIPGKA